MTYITITLRPENLKRSSLSEFNAFQIFRGWDNSYIATFLINRRIVIMFTSMYGGVHKWRAKQNRDFFKN